MNQATQETKLAVIRRIFVAQLCIVAVFCLLVIVGKFRPPVGSFFFVIFLGSLGASIALLRRVRSEKASIVAELAADMTSTLMPLLYGGLLAGVAYLLFMSGILSGDGGDGLFTSNLFPNFTTPDPEKDLITQFLEMKPASMQDFGKLMVWGFVAGYSESFVTGILKQLERRGQDG